MTNTIYAVLFGFLLRDSRMSFFDGGWGVDSNSWHDTFADDVAQVLGVSLQAAGGVMSSLIKKGYLGSEGTGRDGFVYLTERAVGVAL